MTYRLHYWPIPFRGHFVRYVLAHADADWEEAATDALMRLMESPPEDQPLPFMGPPLLHDIGADLWISQVPAILDYLGTRHRLMPADPGQRALTLKIVGDCIDVLEEITRHCGRSALWTPEAWAGFHAQRLPLWMQIFETLGRRHGLTVDGGYMLGGDGPRVADLATAALWHTMVDRLPDLRTTLEQEAPAVAALSDRIAATPRIAAMRTAFDARCGEAYCGGQIEASIRDMLTTS